MKVKLLVVFVTVTGFFGAVYFGLTAKGKPTYPDKAFIAFSKGQFKAASLALNETPSERQALPLNLYKGYVASSMGKHEQAESLLKPLLNASCRLPREELQAQVHLGLIHTAYQQGCDSEIFCHIDAIKKCAPGHPSLLFFDGLSHYLKDQYCEAYRLWNAYYPPHVGKEAAWVTALIEQHYPPSWRQAHLAHCLLERGDITGGRQLLEQQQHQMLGSEDLNYDLSTLFLGLTYLKEASDISASDRSSHYQLAHFYFKSAAKLEMFEREKNCIISHLEQELRSLFAHSLDPKEHVWTFEFIRLLQDWNADLALNSVASQLVSKFVKEKNEMRLAFCEALKKELAHSSFHGFVHDKLMDHLKSIIAYDKDDSFSEVWQFMCALGPSLETSVRELAAFVRAHLFKSIFWDDDQLSRSTGLIAFYRDLIDQPTSDRRLSFDLLHQASEFWQQEGHEKRGALLMELALQIAPQKDEAEEWIGLFLKDLFRSAEENNLLDRLALVHDCLGHFDISLERDLNDNAKVANHVADAEYLYEARNYASAKTHAGWVLKLDPSNQSAMRIVGLCAYQLGEYNTALDLLMNISCPDLTVKKAIAFSSVYAREIPSEHIAQIDASDSFKEDE